MEQPENRIVGVKQTRKALLNGSVQRVFVARDAEKRVTAPIEELCLQQGLELVHCDTMTELGHQCGIEVGAAVAAVLKQR